MQLFKIALRNVRRNSSEYLMYFMSMVFAIMIYFTFASLKYNGAFSEAISSSEKIKTGFRAATIIMGGFSVIFIWYSNLFFTKRRKKEFGLYSLMGVKKRQIGRLHFYETLILGLIAIAAGILTGAFFSKLFAMILVRLMRYKMDVSFFLSWSSIRETLLVFSIIFAVVSFQGYFIAYRYKLIDMFNYSKKKQRQPKSSIWIAIFSIAMIVYSYYLSHTYFYQQPFWGMLFTLLLSITGTYLFFRHFLYIFLKACKKNEWHHYKSINLISNAMLWFKIKSNYRLLSTIAILSAVTLTTIGTAYSFYYLNETDSKAIAPISFSYEYVDQQIDQEVLALISKSKHQLEFQEKLDISRFPLQFQTVETPGIMRDWKTNETYGTFVSLTDYNEIARYQGFDVIQNLAVDETLMIMPYYNTTYFPNYVGKQIVNKGQQLQLTVTQIIDKSLVASQFAKIIFVIPDEVFKTIKDKGDYKSISMFEVNQAKDSGELSKAIKRVLSGNVPLSDYYSVYQQMIQGRGIFVFISAFLGIVFLVATGTIMFFRQLTEINEERANYIILKKIGMTKKELGKTIKKQMLLIFGVPVILGIIHAFVATDILSEVMNVNLTFPIIASFSAYCVIYLAFYFITVSSSIKLLTNH